MESRFKYLSKIAMAILGTVTVIDFGAFEVCEALAGTLRSRQVPALTFRSDKTPGAQCRKK